MGISETERPLEFTPIDFAVSGVLIPPIDTPPLFSLFICFFYIHQTHHQ
jgi:hypothetical protein